ncbi:MAG: sigma-70 family RNA polymerase sigma factor [Clostridia bacterium]|nr:sigma-70 family RNA polymerase sigma factor [Clostridia bacterium]
MENLEEVLLDVKSGNDSAYEKLCDGYMGLLIKLANKYYEICQSNGAEQEEFLQEAKYALYKAACSFKIDNGRATFGNYANRCIRNRLVSLVRKYKSKKRATPVVTPLNESVGGNISNFNCNELGDPMTALAQAKISAFEKKVFSMYLVGMKGKEISQRLGEEEKSVNNAIYRVKVKLKGIIK